ncbi:YacL family protein [Vibrio ordalii]|uniref:Uncharacterized protein n=1 Tax=Vibrio ordalii FS-238 TaxID=617133 RepID=A0A853R413_9VIBR|nr:YacL family protein [Vibrio ordalii]OEE34409.1 hypothetical protein A1QS_06875 [Vibrio ordalii FS-238]
MDYEFKKNTLDGSYYCSFSMGHEIIGRWLQEEISNDLPKIDQVIALMAASKRAFNQEQTLEGQEIRVMILADEVTVQANVLTHGEALDSDSEFDFYDCESTASCGIDDFALMIKQWCEFVRYSPADFT